MQPYEPITRPDAQIELANPEKSLTGMIEPRDGEGSARQYCYAPLQALLASAGYASYVP
jgi:hypothetical protein